MQYLNKRFDEYNHLLKSVQQYELKNSPILEELLDMLSEVEFELMRYISLNYMSIGKQNIEKLWEKCNPCAIKYMLGTYYKQGFK